MTITPDIDPDEFLRDCVRIEPLVIEEEFVRLPSDLAYWNGRFADCQRTYQLAKLDAEETEAKLRIIHREMLLAAGGKTTESQVDSAVTVDGATRDSRVKLIEADVAMKRVGGIVDAIRTKRDMVISLGAHMRAELQGDPVLRHQRAKT